MEIRKRARILEFNIVTRKIMNSETTINYEKTINGRNRERIR